jgi:ankyrin repeat protein
MLRCHAGTLLLLCFGSPAHDRPTNDLIRHHHDGRCYMYRPGEARARKTTGYALLKSTVQYVETSLSYFPLERARTNVSLPTPFWMHGCPFCLVLVTVGSLPRRTGTYRRLLQYTLSWMDACPPLCLGGRQRTTTTRPPSFFAVSLFVDHGLAWHGMWHGTPHSTAYRTSRDTSYYSSILQYTSFSTGLHRLLALLPHIKMASTNTATSTSTTSTTSTTTRDAALQAAPPEWDQLLVACQKNQPELVERLIVQNGVSASHANAIGQSALHVAALWSHTECCRVLLAHGANVHATNTITGATPLHSCAQSSKTRTPQDQLDCIDLLLEQGRANPSMGDFYGSIPMDYVDETNVQLVERLQPTVPVIFQLTMEHAVDAVDDVEHSTITNNNVVKLEELVASDASVVHARHLGLTPLLKLVADICDCKDQEQEKEKHQQKQHPYPFQSVRLQKLEILLRAGADPNHTPAVRRNGHFADVGDHPQEQSSTSASASASASPDGQGCLQRVCNQLAEAYYYRSKHHNDNNNDDDESSTILDLQQAARLLAQHGAVLSSSSSSQAQSQMLHDAARRNLVEWARFLIEDLSQQQAGVVDVNVNVHVNVNVDVNVDVNAKGRQGMTPLQFAARSGKVEMVDYLLSLPNIDPTIPDDRGQTPLDAAKANQKDDIVRKLETHHLSQTVP